MLLLPKNEELWGESRRNINFQNAEACRKKFVQEEKLFPYVHWMHLLRY